MHQGKRHDLNHVAAAVIASAAAVQETGDPMPVFVLKAKDDLAFTTVKCYLEACSSMGLVDQVEQVHRALTEIADWRGRNPDRCKMPDHEHVPATRGVAGLERAALAAAEAYYDDCDNVDRRNDLIDAIDRLRAARERA